MEHFFSGLFYSDVVKIILRYDGDTHMDKQIKDQFTTGVVNKLVEIKSKIVFHEYNSAELLAVVLATHPNNRSSFAVMGHNLSNIFIFLVNFYRLRLEYISEPRHKNCSMDE